MAGAYAANFTIDPRTGELRPLSALDFEAIIANQSEDEDIIADQSEDEDTRTIHINVRYKTTTKSKYSSTATNLI